MRNLKFVVPLFCVFALGACAGSTFVNGMNADKAGKYKEALKYFESCAKSDPYCQYMTANYYFNGTGTDENLFVAMKYYRMASKNNHLASQQVIPLAMAAYIIQQQSKGLPVEDGVSFEEAYAWAIVAEKKGKDTKSEQEELLKQLGEKHLIQAEMLSKEYVKKYVK